MANKKKILLDDPPADIGHTLFQAEDSKALSQQLSELQDLKQNPDAPKIAGYMLLKPIGQGAYAQVWEAIQLHTRKFVAVKVFIKKSGVHWFFLQREAERLLRLDKHPHIVSLLDADLSGEVPYYVMDLAQEGSLEHLFQNKDTPGTAVTDVEKAARWMKEIGQALSYVHNKQIVHCDLKPSNVLLDDEGHIRVADFGHSRILSESGGALGTLFFMAPEQAEVPDETQPFQPDVRWDIYALGCTMYALLSGHVPHEELGSRLMEIADLKERLRVYRESVQAEPVPELLGATLGRVDRDLSAIVAKCMKTDPKGRYNSVSEVLQDLKARLEGKPVSPLAHDKGYWIGKFITRFRVPVAICAIAAVVTLSAVFINSQQKQTLIQDATFNYVLKGREFLDKNDSASAVAYFALSNRVLPSLLARGNAMLQMPPIPLHLFRHNGTIATMAFSPDGKILLTAGGSSGARLWNTATGQPLGRFLKVDGTLTVAAFSPDGLRVVTGDSKGTALLWDTQSQQPVGKPMGHDQEITGVAFSPNGRRLLTASADGTARVWNADTGNPLTPFFRHEKGVFHAEFSPDGKKLLTASLDGTARLWDAEKGEPRSNSIRLRDKGAPGWYRPDVSFSPDGKIILATGWDGSVRFYNDRGRSIGHDLYLQGIGAKAHFSPNGRQILTSVLFGGTLSLSRVWDVQNRTPLKFKLKNGGRILTMAFSPDGAEILTGGTDHRALLWDASTGKPLNKAMWHGGNVTAAAFDPSGKTILTGSDDGLARQWDWEDGNDNSVPLAWKSSNRKHLEKSQTHALFSHDGQKILTYGGKTACLWDASTGKALGSNLAVPGIILRAVYSPDDNHVLICDAGNEARLWNLTTDKTKILPHGVPQFDIQGEHHSPLGQRAAVRGGNFSANGQKFLTGGEDGTVQLWETQEGHPWGLPFATGLKILKSSLSPDGQKVAVLGSDGSLKLYSVEKKGAKLVAKASGIKTAVFSPDNEKLLISQGSNAIVWNSLSGKVLRTLKHGHPLSNVLLSPDGKTAATIGSDGTARLWDIATGEAIGNPLKHERPVQEAAFSPQGEILLLAYQDTGWQFWDVKTGEPIGEETFPGTLVRALGFERGGNYLRFLGKNGDIARVDTSWVDPKADPNRLLLASQVAGMCQVNAGKSVDPIPLAEWVKLWRQYRKAPVP